MEYFDDFDKLESYGGLGYMSEFRKLTDERNAHKIMHAQFDLIKEQQREIIEQRKYRDKSNKASKLSLILAIVGIVIALLTLIASIIGWFI